MLISEETVLIHVPYLINYEYEIRHNDKFINKLGVSALHGGAEWLRPSESNNNLTGKNGIPLGLSTESWYPKQSPQGGITDRSYPVRVSTIHYTGKKHLITIAPSGSGKGTAVQIPVLLEYDASIVMIDPKGENAIVTASYRKKTLKQEVYILNPFGVLAKEFKEQDLSFHTFNPLDALDIKTDGFVADVAALCEALITSEGNDPYWSNAARELISCLIMFVCSDAERHPERKNLVRVRELLTQTETELLEFLTSIAKNPDSFKPLRQKASLFANSSKGNAAIISTAITQTSFLDDPLLSKNLSRSDFKFSNLKDKPTTIYVILPARFMVAYSKWFRVIITSALDALMSTHKQPEKPVLFMLDECATIGYLSAIETAVGLARGYGIQIWSFFQDIHQLKSIYGNRSESFLSNTGIQQIFTPNDFELADRISKRIGKTTVRVQPTSYNRTESNSGGTSNNSISTNEIGVLLIQPTDIIGMDMQGQILFSDETNKPIYACKNHYYLETSIYHLEARAKPNPYRI